MRINKRHIRNIDNYLAAVPDGSKFRIMLSNPKVGQLNRLGFQSEPPSGSTILPSIVGPVSRFNAEGKWEVHRDQPKESRYVRTVRWRWKQWAGRGQTEEHEDFRDIYRDCYPRDRIEPPSVELIYLKHSGDAVIVSEVMTKDEEMLDDAKHGINLFLELFGSCEIVGADMVSYPSSIVKKVNWRMLPPGQYPWDRLEKHIRDYHGSRSKDGLAFILDRMTTITAFGPEEIYHGDGGFLDYVAYRFKKLGLVVMESIRRDNAIYVFGEDWAQVSVLTKKQILDGGRHKERIVHSKEWKTRLSRFLKRAA